MALQLSRIVLSLITALLYFSSSGAILGKNAQKIEPTKPTKHGEVYRAKSEIDSLIYKLTLDLNTFNDKKTMAAVMQKDAEKLARIAEEEIALLRPVQHLLDKLAKGNATSGYQPCIARPVGKILVRIKATGSSLPKHYTISVPVNHRELIDRGLSHDNGEDLHVYYHDNGQHPVQVDRVISGLGTKLAAVQFRLQAPISANTIDDMSYFLVLGASVSGSAMDNPDKVYAFYDDFSSSALKKEWAKSNWGKWRVQNERLLGSTMQTKNLGKGNMEVGLYLRSGFQWKDVEVELDMMETGTKNSCPGPFLRLSDVNPSKTTAWWFQYFPGRPHTCDMRPQANNKGGNRIYGKLPIAFKLNKWLHFKYRVLGDRFSQWENGKIVHDNVKVSKQWMIPAGTFGLGCHRSPNNCKTLFDNIKVTLLVAYPPKITLGSFQPLSVLPNRSALLGEKKLPADSCKQIHDASLVKNKPRAKNGVYWIKTDLQGSSSVQTYCDMKNGGWTLVGKISGNVGTIYKTWLVSNYNTAALKTPKLTKQKGFACIDARSLAVEEASMVLLSSGERMDGLGSKWVMWRLPGDREKDTFWRHSVGASAVKAAVQTPVMAYAWNGNKKICYQKKFGLMPYPNHGGAYPYASYNTAGDCAPNEYCMTVGVTAKGSRVHGWSNNGNSNDCPSSDSDWPNRSYNHHSPHLTVWLK